MALAKLLGRRSLHPVHHAPATHRRPRQERVGPAVHVPVLVGREKLGRAAVRPSLDEAAVPGKDRDVGDAVARAAEVLALREPAIEHVELALHLHGEPIDRVFDLGRGIEVEVPEASAEVGRAPHLPEQPGQDFGAGRLLAREQGAELLGQVDEDRAGLEDAHGGRSRAVHERRNLGVRIDRDEAATELLALVDLDQPGVVFRPGVPERKQLFEHDGDLHPVRRAQRIELQGVTPHRELLVVRGARDRPVDVRKGSAAALGPGPDRRWLVLGGIRHVPSPQTRGDPLASQSCLHGPGAETWPAGDRARGAAAADGTPARPCALARCSTSCIIDAKSQGEPDCGSGLIHAHRRRWGSRAPRVGDRAPRVRARPHDRIPPRPRWRPPSRRARIDDSAMRPGDHRDPCKQPRRDVHREEGGAPQLPSHACAPDVQPIELFLTL